MSACKHCGRCKGGCDVCACCGTCQRCGKQPPVMPQVPQLVPVPLVVPQPVPVPLAPADHWIPPWYEITCSAQPTFHGGTYQ